MILPQALRQHPRRLCNFALRHCGRRQNQVDGPVFHGIHLDSEAGLPEPLGFAGKWNCQENLQPVFTDSECPRAGTVFEFLTHGVDFGGVAAADLSYLRCNVSIAQISAQCHLLRLAGGLGEPLAMLPERLCKLRRQHHERNSNAGSQHVGERAQVHDVVLAGQGVERRRRVACVEEVVVEVIFNDEAAVGGTVGNELHSALYGHDLAVSRHMGGGDVDDVRVLVLRMALKPVAHEGLDGLLETLVGERDRARMGEQHAENVHEGLHAGPPQCGRAK